MTESQSVVNLVTLFDQASRAVVAQREEINALDGYNGNHGDNMVENMRLITEAVHAHSADSPSDALRSAGEQLRQAGRGGTSQYYSQGLLETAEKLEGHTAMTRADGVTLLETLLGAIPSQGSPDQGQTAGSVLDMVMGMAGAQEQTTSQPQAPGQLGGLLDMVSGLTDGQQSQPEPEPQPNNQLGSLLDIVSGLSGGQQPQPEPQSNNQLGGLLDMVAGLTGAQQPQPEPEPQPANQLEGLLGMVTELTGAQPPQAEPEGEGQGGLGGLFGKLLPAGLAYLQAQQSGADPAIAKLAFIRALLGARPSQSQTPREAAGTVIAQSIMQALMAR